MVQSAQAVDDVPARGAVLVLVLVVLVVGGAAAGAAGVVRVGRDRALLFSVGRAWASSVLGWKLESTAQQFARVGTNKGPAAPSSAAATAPAAAAAAGRGDVSAEADVAAAAVAAFALAKSLQRATAAAEYW